MSETDALLSTPGHGTKRDASKSTGGVCGCCSSGPLGYTDISASADEAISQLVEELSQQPSANPALSAKTGGRDTRILDALQRTWSAVAADANDSFPTTPPKLPNREWRRLGFQGDDPCTDMRGAGLAGFTYLARFCEEYAEARIVGASCDVEMPLGIGSINVLYMLRCHLQLMDDVPSFCPCCGSKVRDEYSSKQQYGGRHLRGFAMLLLDDPDVFFHVYALAVLVTANLWRKRFGVAKISSAATVKTVSTIGKSKETPRDTRASSGTASTALSLNSLDTTQADPRLLEFNDILHEGKNLIMDGLANFPPDLSSLRINMFKRLRAMPSSSSSVASRPGMSGTSPATESVSSQTSRPIPMTPSKEDLAGASKAGASPAGAAATRYGSAKRQGAPAFLSGPSKLQSEATYDSYRPVQSSPHHGRESIADRTSMSMSGHYRIEGSQILDVEEL